MDTNHHETDLCGQLGDSTTGEKVYHHIITTETNDPKVYIRTEFNERWGKAITTVDTQPFVSVAGRGRSFPIHAPDTVNPMDRTALLDYHRARVTEYMLQAPL